MWRAVIGVLLVLSATAALRAEKPETVMVTLRAKPGTESEVATAPASHWTIARTMKLVDDRTHITMKTTDAEGRVTFVDVFTRCDPAIPDAAPPEILAVWNEMTRLSDARGGRPGLEIVAVDLIQNEGGRLDPSSAGRR